MGFFGECPLAEVDMQWHLLQSLVTRHGYARLYTAVLAPRWALGQEVKCHGDILAQGLYNKHQSEKEEFARVQRAVVRWFGLPFPTASNIRVAPSLSKPFESLGRPPKTLPAVWLPERAADGFDHETTPSRGFLAEELPSSACCATSRKQIAKTFCSNSSSFVRYLLSA